jgi:predicted dehydrogenase
MLCEFHLHRRTVMGNYSSPMRAFISPLSALFTVLLLAVLPATGAEQAASAAPRGEKPLRAGIIGLDTSHAIAFTKLLNDPKAGPEVAGVKVVAAFPGGSPDFPPSRDRVAKFTQDVQGLGVTIMPSIPALLENVDVVLLESVDGRVHLEQVKPVFAAGKPVFIDKPLGGTLAQAVAIAELGEKHNAKWFSSSSLRYGEALAKALADEKVGKVLGATTWGPCEIQPTHPDLFWYGIHGIDMLYAAMGTGCVSVTRVHTDGTDVVTGVWKDSRVGTYRGVRGAKTGFGAVLFGEKSSTSFAEKSDYKPLVAEIVKFFKTGKAPVSSAETVELFAFMEAADESKRQGGKAVLVEDVLAKARAEAKELLK